MHRLRSVLLISLLAAGLGACGRPGPSGGPAAPRPNPATPPLAKPKASPAATQRQLHEALSTAEDLFNRGENDLACEQVQRAQGLRQRLTATPPDTSDDQLARFSRACPAL